jgi:DNA-binding MarR family transcriptional regulator
MIDSETGTRERNATDLAACTCANLRQAARVVTRAYDAALQPAGLKATQFNLLATLAQGGNAPLTRLADALVMDRTTLTRNLKPLVRRGLIRIGHDDDQRIRKVGLTAEGKRVFEQARPRWAQAQARIVESLGQARWSGFLDDLTAAVAAVRDR